MSHVAYRMRLMSCVLRTGGASFSCGCRTCAAMRRVTCAPWLPGRMSTSQRERKNIRLGFLLVSNMPALVFLLRAARTRLASVFGAFALATVLGACSSPKDEPSDPIVVGLLLPFTGASVGTAYNFERAALFAQERVSAAGGVNGRPFRIVSADTHSDLARARRSVDSLLNAGATVVVGPESAEIAAQIGPYLAERGVTFLSPLIGAATDAEVDCGTPWFRLAPSAQDLGEALAKQIAASGVQVISVMY